MSERDYVESLHRRIETLQAQRHHDILKNTTMYARLKAYESAIEGITQEMVDNLRFLANADAFALVHDNHEDEAPGLSLHTKNNVSDAADILQALLDAGGYDE